MKAILEGRCDGIGLGELIELSSSAIEIEISEGETNSNVIRRKKVSKDYILEKDNFSHVIFERFELNFDGFTLELETQKKKTAPHKIVVNFEENLDKKEMDETIETINKIAFDNDVINIEKMY
jgi:hypothetical protein